MLVFITNVLTFSRCFFIKLPLYKWGKTISLLKITFSKTRKVVGTVML
ncbi:hypothetical protein WZ211_1812 [Enterococcus faecalis]|nr:hypothetical protein D927_00981 [Enterococcus faecalis 02-MB-BW-10]OSH32213.1 hypothetical protein WZ211_1812 [Enterococcus faecalis]